VTLTHDAGALHWGLEFAGYNGSKGYPRLLLGATPVVFAWSTLALDPVMALVAQWVGYTGLWYADMKATSAGWSEYLAQRLPCVPNADERAHFSPEMVLAI
jgi:hypothetical protein